MPTLPPVIRRPRHRAHVAEHRKNSQDWRCYRGAAVSARVAAAAHRRASRCTRVFHKATHIVRNVLETAARDVGDGKRGGLNGESGLWLGGGSNR